MVELCVEYMCVGLVVKASASRAEDPGFESPLAPGFFLSHTSDLKIGTPVAALPGTWHYSVSAGVQLEEEEVAGEMSFWGRVSSLPVK